MKKYQDESGLNFQVDDHKLIYNKEEFPEAVDWEKTFKDGSYAYQNPESSLEVIYFGARYFEEKNDLEKIPDFMCDVTLLEEGKIGEEFVKTVGHYHSKVHGLALAYPEVYEVIDGKIEYLLQSEPDENGGVDVLWVIAGPGDKVVMIPNYGHVSMNTGAGTAVEIDVQKRDLPKTSDYSLFKEKMGGALYRAESGLLENPNYKINSLRIVKPKERPEWGLTKNLPLYTSLVNNPEKFGYLLNPQDFNFDIDDLFEDVEL